MTFRVYRADRTCQILPTALEWAIVQTGGVPCDSIEVTCLWDGSDCDAIQWHTVEAEQDGEIVFRGVVDECVASMSGTGMTLTVSGRGMAAVLLDNEAVGCDYQLATVDDIIRDHITPYGIDVGDVGVFPAVSQFSVTTGRSEWSVVEDFCSRYRGIAPWFDGAGTLWLSQRHENETLVIDDNVAVMAMECRHRRYGVLSEVLLRSRNELREISVKNEDVIALGGQCRRVMTLLNDTSAEMGRADGEFLLAQSAEKLVEVEVIVGKMLFDAVGKMVRLSRAKWAYNGNYCITETVVSFGNRGYQTRLRLSPMN